MKVVAFRAELALSMDWLIGFLSGGSEGERTVRGMLHDLGENGLKSSADVAGKADRPRWDATERGVASDLRRKVPDR